MRLLLVAKSAYSGTGSDGRAYPAILSGMTVGFVRGLVRTALAQGHPLTYVFPAFTGPSGPVTSVIVELGMSST